MAQFKKEPDSPDAFSYLDAASPNSSLNNDSKKKRVGKACDSCRIKKCRCDGRKPCSKCIADNKICVYSERKRPRDKVYPTGYVELLETRLDLVSKSLEKLLDLSISGEDLNFLRIPGEKFNVNKIINQLVKDHGLLDNQPVEWDTATKLAAELPDDTDGIVQISHTYAEHAKQLNYAAEAAAASKLKDKQERKKNKAKAKKGASESTNSSLSPDRGLDNSEVQGSGNLAKLPLSVKTEPISDDQVDLKNDFNLQGFQPREDFSTPLDLGQFSSGAAIAAAAMEGGLSMSDFESDNNRNTNSYSPVRANSPFSESDWNGSGIFNSDPKTAEPSLQTHNSLFLDTGRAASSHDLLNGNTTYTSLNSALFNENPPSNIHISPGSPKIEAQLRRSNSKPYSVGTAPSGKKFVNNHSGQIAKPHHHHHHRSNSASNPVRSNSGLSSPEFNAGLQSSNSLVSNINNTNSSNINANKTIGDDLNILDMISLSPADTDNLNETLDSLWIDQAAEQR